MRSAGTTLFGLLLAVGLSGGRKAQAEDPPPRPALAAVSRLEWFQRDKFGLFIHFGPYSVLGGEWQGQRMPVEIGAEWIMQPSIFRCAITANWPTN